jgi:uncharacterized protein (DUF1501 family)
MKRRDFINFTSSSVFLPILLGGYSAKAHMKSTTAFMKAMEQIATANDRILVVIQLSGGNDGLNTVIPLDQYGSYSAASFRGNIAIPEAKILKLNNRPELGLHPAMTGLQSLFNEGKLSIIHSAGYTNPNFSHFGASDVWFTADNTSKIITSGWLGRYIENQYSGFPDDYPNAQNPDPLAIQISSISSTTFATNSVSAALAIQDPDTFAKIVGEKPNILEEELPNTVAGKYTAFVRQQQLTSVAYAGGLKIAAGKGKNFVTYPTQNTLADQLKIVARLIGGGLQTKIYYVNLGGFDTHSAQVDNNDSTTGKHAELLKDLSDGIKAFMDDLKAQGNDGKVVGMTFSEFGRRAISNGSKGTDHGWASPMFVFGNAVKSQIIGQNPNLKDLEKDNVKMQTDFRQVYASILQDWMGASEATTRTILLDSQYNSVPIFKQSILGNEWPMSRLIKIYPNPSADFLNIESESFASGITSLQISDQLGRSTFLNWKMQSPNQIQMDISSLPTGTYHLNMQSFGGNFKEKFMVIK